MNAVFILWLRQLKRYFRSRARMAGLLGQPTLFLLALGFGLGPTFARAGGGSYVQFLAPGIVTMGILFTAVFSGIEIIWDRQFGFLKEMLAAPVSTSHSAGVTKIIIIKSPYFRGILPVDNLRGRIVPV